MNGYEELKMQFDVKADFCGTGVSCSCHGGTTYLIFPKLRVETSRGLTAGERSAIEDAIVKAAEQELAKIAEGGEA